MDPKPLKNYNKPDFPTADEAKYHKDFPFDYIPERWVKTIIASGAAVFLIAGGLYFHDMNGTCYQEKTSGHCIIEEGQNFLNSISDIFYKPPSLNARLSGVIMTDSRISEADVKKEIEDRFKKEKVTFELKNYNAGTKSKPLILDGYSPEKKLGYKIIYKDLREIALWSGKKADSFKSSKNAAGFMQKELLKKKKIKCAVIVLPQMLCPKNGLTNNEMIAMAIRQTDDFIRKNKK
ncbi:MAG: hypothetical protein LWY06_18410 [Firmicutes bacterium]|nr:hypothetical protein [Bacillota bacterium]